MADSFESPVDVGGETPPTALSGLAQMMTAVGIATFTLLLLNAHALAGWAEALPPDARTAPIVQATARLAQTTAARGLDRPRAALKQGWDRVKAAEWPAGDQRKKL
jgi:hypothetical protein